MPIAQGVVVAGAHSEEQLLYPLSEVIIIP